MVSVIVPVYNVAEYLDSCIQTIVDQTYRNIEIILVDDGSTDVSGDMCDQWAQRDSRIKVIHKVNGGLGMARNTGMEHATGKYAFFLDSDDYVDPSLIQKCVLKAVEDNSEVVIYGRKNVYENGEIVQDHIKATSTVFRGECICSVLLPAMLTYDFGFGVSAWGKMYDLQLLKEKNLEFVSEREIISEDVIYALELFPNLSSVSIIPEGLYFYRRRSVSLSRKYRKDRQKQNEVFLQKSMAYVDEKNLPAHIKLHLQARYHGMTLAALMQIMRSDMSKSEKQTAVDEILHSRMLQETLGRAVCRLDGRRPRVFWTLLRYKCYTLCALLLHCNAYK